TPVLDPWEAARHPHMAARGSWLAVDGILQTAAAPRFSGWAQKTPAKGPARDEHGGEIRADLADPDTNH
ncbi:CoA transferase, partial [Mesorhizobium sp. BHbdii]